MDIAINDITGTIKYLIFIIFLKGCLEIFKCLILYEGNNDGSIGQRDEKGTTSFEGEDIYKRKPPELTDG